MYSLLLFVFLMLFSIRPISSGQIMLSPIYTPCDFPSPVYSPPDVFAGQCTRIKRLPFICDLHNQLAYLNIAGIETAYERYKAYFTHQGNSTLAVIIVKQLEAPASTDAVYGQIRYKCLFENECNLMDNEVVGGFVNNVKTFLKVYAWKVYERWFALDEKCTQPNVLALVVIDGLVNDARKIPYVRIHSGESKLKFPLGNIQSEATNALVQGWPLQIMVESLVDDIGYAVKEMHELNGEPRDHSVPRWARHVFLLCAVLVIGALIIEWYIVRRKLGVQKSGAALKIASGKSKTHLMF